MASQESWTIGRLLAWTTDFLKQHGAESPRLDAEVLLAHARGCGRIDLYASFDEPASDELRGAFRELVRRRAEGVPVAYLVGRREFFSLPFRVTRDVLIPRPETELLVTALLDRIKQRAQTAGESAAPPRVVDVGTGSGVIAICAAKYGRCRVTAIDVSRQALEVARGNAQLHGVQEAVTFLSGDLLEPLPPGEKFDFIVSNPPYVKSGEMESLAKEVREHEPRLALEAGPKGTETIERLLLQAAERLTPGGMLLLEISPMLEHAVGALLAADQRFRQGPTLKDLAGHARVIQATRTAD